jgi:hypothetical protein
MRRLACASILAFVLAPAASAAGPWLGTLNGGSGLSLANAEVSYVTHVRGNATTVDAVRNGRVVATTSVAGRWGVPYVTLNSGIGGLSANGRVLVLAERFSPTGALAARTAFTVLDTKPLAVRSTVKVRGDYGFDTLSPDGRTLYLIQHVSAENLLKYRVRAYDLGANRLVKRVIADKRQASWDMTGYPVARAASGDGRWVYTLYSSGDNYPFVHALDTKGRTAVCIGLPWDWVASSESIMRSVLTVKQGALEITGDNGNGPSFAIDTRTFKVSKL